MHTISSRIGVIYFFAQIAEIGVQLLRSQHLNQNEGQASICACERFRFPFTCTLVINWEYGVLKLDKLVDEIVRQQFSQICMASSNDIIAQLKSWADHYDRCSFAAKKMIISQFVKAVYVHRDYDIEIEFNLSFEEFRALTITRTAV